MTVAQPVARLNRLALWVRVGLIIVFTAWLFVMLGRTQTRFPGEASPEVTFARDMSAHHEQAVAMSLQLRERLDDPELRSFTLDVALTQQAQIGQMQGWLAVWDVPVSGLEPPMQGLGTQMGMATRTDLNALHTLPLDEAENLFLRLMIRHHEGGVTMAEAVLEQTRRPEVRRLAQAIVQGQTSEIAYMTDLLEERGVPPSEPSVDRSGMDH